MRGTWFIVRLFLYKLLLYAVSALRGRTKEHPFWQLRRHSPLIGNFHSKSPQSVFHSVGPFAIHNQCSKKKAKSALRRFQIDKREAAFCQDRRRRVECVLSERETERKERRTDGNFRELPGCNLINARRSLRSVRRREGGRGEGKWTFWLQRERSGRPSVSSTGWVIARRLLSVSFHGGLRGTLKSDSCSVNGGENR